MLGDLPQLEGGFPDASGAVGPTVMVACDHSYLAQFGKALALSLNRNSPGWRLHLHVFDPGPDIAVELKELEAQLPETALTATWEGTRGAGPAYFASVRFARLYQLYDACGTDVLCLDADTLILRDLGAVAETAAEADIAAWTRFEVPELQNKIWASAVLVRQTDAGRRFLARLAAYLAATALEGRLSWWLDQCAIYITWRMMEFEGDPVVLARAAGLDAGQDVRPGVGRLDRQLATARRTRPSSWPRTGSCAARRSKRPLQLAFRVGEDLILRQAQDEVETPVSLTLMPSLSKYGGERRHTLRSLSAD